jgi:hypothetical protein
MQGSTSLVVITAIHAGLVAALFWTLLANALVATQVVEDGTRSSLVVRAPTFPTRHSSLMVPLPDYSADLLSHHRLFCGHHVHIPGRRSTFHQHF